MEGFDLPALLAPHLRDLLALRRDLHAHPELGRQEVRTTRVLAERLTALGLLPRLLPGTGVVCDVGDFGPIVAIRGDLDALPLPDESGVPFGSTVEGVAHACGHDMHTAAVFGTGVLLAELASAGRLPGRVRLIFQPAEEVLPGGALDVIAAGGLDEVERIYALHCDPHTDVGVIGSRVGPVTAAADSLLIRLSGRGGHTSRPHLTEDVVFALGQLITAVPGGMSRRIDPRAAASLVWGRVAAGSTFNAIPRSGELMGSFRCMDAGVWAEAGALLPDLVREIVRPYGVHAEIDYIRGMPPTVNDPEAVAVIEAAARDEFGAERVVLTPQSLGAEDFAWMLEKVPGAMVRLGTRTPGGATHDLHRPDFTVDERALGVGVRLLTATVYRDLSGRSRT